MKKLSVFDIDHTLFITKAAVQLERDGEIVRTFENSKQSEYLTYKLKPNENFNYSQHRSAQFFFDTSEPIYSVIDILHEELKSGDVILLTARPDLDNRELFLSKLKLYIPIDKIHVERSGNYKGLSHETKPKLLRDRYLGKYNHYRMYDDQTKNLDSFLHLKNEQKDATFDAFFVEEGKITPYF